MTLDEHSWIMAAALVLAALAIVLTVWKVSRDNRKTRDAAASAAAELATLEIARIEEKVRTTAVGMVCLVLLIINHVAFLVLWGQVASAIQQAALAAAYVGTTILFGLGVALGRRRTMIVYRSQRPE